MAEAYVSELTLSSYSMLLSVDDSYLLNPNAYIPQSVLLHYGARASIVRPKYRFSFSEPIH
jgi:hypothetical protein